MWQRQSGKGVGKYECLLEIAVWQCDIFVHPHIVLFMSVCVCNYATADV